MLVTTPQEFELLINDLDHAPAVVFDTETNGLNVYRGDKMIGMSFYFPDFDRSYYIPFRHGEGVVGDPLLDGDEFDRLSWTTKRKKEAYTQRILMERGPDYSADNLIAYLLNVREAWNEAVHRGAVFIGHNTKFDLHVLANEGFNVPYRVFDTLLALNLVLEDWAVPFKLGAKTVYGNRQLKWQGVFWNLLENAREGEEELEAAVEALKLRLVPDDERGRKRLQIDSKAQMWLLHPSEVAHYAELDTILTWRLYERLYDILMDWEQHLLFQDLCRVQTAVAFPMERNGFVLDYDASVRERDAAGARLREIEAKLGFNPQSNREALEALNALGLELKAVNKEALDPHKDHPTVQMLREYRRWAKADATYLKRWQEHAGYDGRVHPTFRIDGTVSGRWSSGGDAGNFQNIPDRGFYRIKSVLKPLPDHVIVAMDYGQLEARLAAWIAEGQLGLDRNMSMTKLFNDGIDMHSYTRDTVNVRGVVYGDMTDAEILHTLGQDTSSMTAEDMHRDAQDRCRFIGKTMNFGLIYGGGRRMLSKLLKIDEDTAAVLVGAWRELYPAFIRAQRYYHELALTWRPNPSGKGQFQYVTQPLSNRTRKFHFYPTEAYAKDDDGRWVQYNRRDQQARKAWNNVVQGLGGYINAISALRIVDTFPTQIKPAAAIHDALELMVHKDALSVLPTVLELFTDWPTDPGLTVDWKASADNWQDLRKVVDFDLWVTSGGELGYKGL